MANLTRFVDVQDGGTTLTGTQTATITTDDFNPGKCEEVGFYVKISSPVSLTSLIITINISFDGGTNFTELTDAPNSATQATVKTLSAADDAFERWEVKLPDEPDIVLQSVWTLTGTSYDVDAAKWLVR